MPRRAKGLTAAFVEKTTKPGRSGDGGGLYLLVQRRKALSKFWLFRYPGPDWSVIPSGKKRRKKREMGLGPAMGRNRVSLSQARTKARELHAMVRAGRDPLEERDAERAKADEDATKAKTDGMTFADVAGLYLAAHGPGWRSPKHRKQWLTSLDQHAMPTLRDLPIGSIDTGAVIKVLEPLWRTKTETAARVRGRIEAVLDYAKARGWREGENPARWRGHIDQLLPKRSKVRLVQHHAALRWREIGAFVQRLRYTFSVSARCLEFLILTACRSGEVRGARWDELDLTHAVWTVPAKRMKGGREHRVPLSEPATAVLHDMAQLGNEGFVFPGMNAASMLSNVTLARLVEATGGAGATVHGFRSTFRDWAGEHTNFPRELAEMCLAHRTFQSDDGQMVGGKTELAYKRGDQLEKRRMLMEAWAVFCSKPMAIGEVVPLHAAR
jgi:integrase